MEILWSIFFILLVCKVIGVMDIGWLGVFAPVGIWFAIMFVVCVIAGSFRR